MQIKFKIRRMKNVGKIILPLFLFSVLITFPGISLASETYGTIQEPSNWVLEPILPKTAQAISARPNHANLS